MKKKIILLIGLLFLLCGCSAEVNLEIKDEQVSETVVIHAYPSGDYTMERLPGAFLKNVPAYAKDILAEDEGDVRRKGISYYTRTQEEIVNGYKFTYKYNFKLSNYKDARTIKNGFKSSNVYVDKVANTILFSTDSGGLRYFSDEYPNLDTVKVNIKTTYKVEEHNADYVNGNVYTWEFRRDNTSKGIYLLLDKTVNGTGEEKPNDKDDTSSVGNSTGDKKNEQNTNTKREESNSKIEDEMNKHPFVFVIIGVILFIIVVFLLTRVTKITKVK